MWDLGRAGDMLADRRFALTATTIIILTLVHPTATTDQTGLSVACLSAPAPGMAGDALGVGVAGVAVGVDVVSPVAALTADTDLSADEDSPVDETSTADTPLQAVRLAASTAARCTVVADSTVAAVVSTAVAAVVSMAVAAVDSTAALAVDTVVVDTGKG